MREKVSYSFEIAIVGSREAVRAGVERFAIAVSMSSPPRLSAQPTTSTARASSSPNSRDPTVGRSIPRWPFRGSQYAQSARALTAARAAATASTAAG